MCYIFTPFEVAPIYDLVLQHSTSQNMLGSHRPHSRWFTGFLDPLRLQLIVYRRIRWVGPWPRSWFTWKLSYEKKQRRMHFHCLGTWPPSIFEEYNMRITKSSRTPSVHERCKLTHIYSSVISMEFCQDKHSTRMENDNRCWVTHSF